MSDAQRTHERLALEESETVVARGYRKITWFIKDGTRWIPATAWPQASADDREPGPGTVWARLVKVSLEVGTMLMCVDSRPTARAPRDVLEYLKRETRLAEREAHRAYYRVAQGRGLERIASAPEKLPHAAGTARRGR